MLYEVITSGGQRSDASGQPAQCPAQGCWDGFSIVQSVRPPERVAQHIDRTAQVTQPVAVITSYSIHYTKLYEPGAAAVAPRFRS